MAKSGGFCAKALFASSNKASARASSSTAVNDEVSCAGSVVVVTVPPDASGVGSTGAAEPSLTRSPRSVSKPGNKRPTASVRLSAITTRLSYDTKNLRTKICLAEGSSGRTNNGRTYIRPRCTGTTCKSPKITRDPRWSSRVIC